MYMGTCLSVDSCSGTAQLQYFIKHCTKEFHMITQFIPLGICYLYTQPMPLRVQKSP